MKPAKRTKLDPATEDKMENEPKERSAQDDLAPISTAIDNPGRELMPNISNSTIGDESADTSTDAAGATEDTGEDECLEAEYEDEADSEDEDETNADTDDVANSVNQTDEQADEGEDEVEEEAEHEAEDIAEAEGDNEEAEEEEEDEAEDDDEWWNPPESDSDSDSDSSSSAESGKTNETTFVTEDGKYAPLVNLESHEPAKNKDIDLRRYAMVNWQVVCDEAREAALATRVLAEQT